MSWTQTYLIHRKLVLIYAKLCGAPFVGPCKWPEETWLQTMNQQQDQFWPGAAPHDPQGPQTVQHIYFFFSSEFFLKLCNTLSQSFILAEQIGGRMPLVLIATYNRGLCCCCSSKHADTHKNVRSGENCKTQVPQPHMKALTPPPPHAA